jgi:hypothetical protein
MEHDEDLIKKIKIIIIIIIQTAPWEVLNVSTTTDSQSILL